jgi:uncharacterized protein YdhG (YjbR/CyaY superfamily)
MRNDFKNVDEYIALQPESIRGTLELLRRTIKNAIPGAEEKISYQMPSYHYHGVVAWFAGLKGHYSLYVRPFVQQAFKDRLKGYDLSKSAIRFPLDFPVPGKLISDIVKYAAAENYDQKMQKKEKAKKKNIR